MTETPETVERRGMHHRLYRWVLRWSAHPRSGTALFVLALAEASFFPLPPDLLLVAMVLARPARMLRYAAIATAGSVLGGLIGVAIGWGAWQMVEGFAFGHLGFLGFTSHNFEYVQGLYQANAFLALLGAAISPIPYKVFTIAAGVFGIGIPVFILASLLGRGARFFVVAIVLGFGGPAMKPFIEKHLGWLSLAFVALLVLGFLLIGLLGGRG